MISFSFELLVMEMIGVIWSNCRIIDVVDIPSSFGITISYHRKPQKSAQLQPHSPYDLGNTHHKHQIILLQIHPLDHPTPSTATSIVHPNTCKNLLDICRFTSSSSTNSTRGGTAQPGTNVDRRTWSFCVQVHIPRTPLYG